MKSGILVVSVILIVAAHSTAVAGTRWWCVGSTFVARGYAHKANNVEWCYEKALDANGRGGCCADNYDTVRRHPEYIPARWAIGRDGLTRHKNDPCPYCFYGIRKCSQEELYPHREECVLV